ncbi:MAG: TrmH family RNA methyltransferase [Fimbriimonadaceae bacterium]
MAKHRAPDDPDRPRTLTGKTAVRKLHREIRRTHDSDIEIAFLLQDWSDAYNVGGMFRVADACGALELFVSGSTPLPPNPMVSVTSLGHHRRIPYHEFDRHEDAAKAARAKGYAVVAIEMAEGAVAYDEFEYPKRVCFALGNEQRGVYQAVMKHRDAAVFIPMRGKGRSMNVHVSAAVVAFHAIHFRRSVPGDG